MPRTILARSMHADRPRTMSSVSDELGVSPSTLRTWERRYNFGLTQREAGERRRYQPEGVDRLRTTIHHMRAGMSAAEIVKRALAESTLLPRRGPASAVQLCSVALSDNHQYPEEVIKAVAAGHGPVHTWSRFVEPTPKSLRSALGGEPISSAPALMLVNASQCVCRSVYQSRLIRSLVGGNRVAVISDSLHETVAQVIGVALAWYSCDVCILSSENYDGVSITERFREYVREGVPIPTVVLGCGPECAQTMANLVARYRVSTIMVGADTPKILSPQVQRVRTTSVCVEEVPALSVPQAGLELVGCS